MMDPVTKRYDKELYLREQLRLAEARNEELEHLLRASVELASKVFTLMDWQKQFSHAVSTTQLTLAANQAPGDPAETERQ